jgi:hypothetical protein
MRLVGWSFGAEAVDELSAALERNESHAGVVRHLVAVGPDRSIDVLNAEVYVSVPFSGRSAATTRMLDRWVAEIEEALEVAGREIGVDLFLRAPGLIGRAPEELRRIVRSGLRRSVLHVVVGAGRGSTGIGREVTASIAHRRPVVWLVPPGDDVPTSIAVSAEEANLEIVPVSAIDEIPGAVIGAVKRNELAIRQLLREKDQIPVAVIELQEELRKRWMRKASPELLKAARISRERAVLLLTDPFALFHETSVSELDAFASVLGLDVLAVQQAVVKPNARASS